MATYQMSFNQDFSSICVLRKQTIRLFCINVPGIVDELFAKEDTEEIRIIERLFNSSLVVLVTTQKPNCLRMIHFKKKQDICNCYYPTEILCVRMNRLRLICCLAQSIHIHDIRDMKILHSIENIAPNELGVCALSLNSYLAFPICTSSGKLRIFNASKLQNGFSLKAHDTSLSALVFSLNGSLLATASERGTVIRVFCVKNGQRVQEFRRGVKRTVRISSLVFATTGDFICAASNTETVHVFKIDANAVEQAEIKGISDSAQLPLTAIPASVDNSKQTKTSPSSVAHTSPTNTTTTPASTSNSGTKTPVPVSASSSSSSWSGYFSKAVSSYLIPTQVSDVLAQDRAFATVVLAQPGLKHICALRRVGGEHNLFIACEDGFLYIHEFDKERGGICKKLAVHDLRGPLDGVTELDLTESIEICKQETSPAKTTNSQIVKSSASVVLIENPDPMPDNSYAGILRGEQGQKEFTDSAKFRKLCDAIDTPTKLYDESQFPPVAIPPKD